MINIPTGEFQMIIQHVMQTGKVNALFYPLDFFNPVGYNAATMSRTISRRDFLKVGGLALGSLAFLPSFPRQPEHSQGKLGRVTIDQIDLRSEPSDEAPIIGNRFRDQLVHIYYEVTPADAPRFYNPLWYRVWGGYLHSAYIQIVELNVNQPLIDIPQSGRLCEVTVPYTTAYQYSQWDGWHPWRGTRLYYGTTHWATGIEAGPDGKAWYQVTSEISETEVYYVPAQHLRPISAEELAPISPQVPAEDKHIEVSISQQTLRAYEYDKEVFSARVSSGIPSSRTPRGGLPTATPTGEFRIYSKLPSKHMGSVTGNPDALGESGFSLPGVPWTSFFKFPGGYAFHGTYWHNNFGLQMSHGCVNMRNEDAKWLFRWTTPAFEDEIKDHSDWEKRGNGTRVSIA
jgi:lipoprotein-anchoring transpeptidase ErfK/SrfK